MATVNKNFRIKHGLIVEGTSGTINGQNILTETGSDSYILNLVGGATLVKSVEATQLEVNGAGKLSIKSGVFDPAGSAASAQTAAESYADGLAVNYDAAGAAAAAQTAAQGYADTAAGNAQTAAESYADGLAVNYDAAGAAAAAQTAAQGYADTAAGNAQTAAESYADGLAVNYDAAGAAAAAQTAAQGYADTAAGNAQTAAESYADGLAVNYDAAGAAATAQSNAEDYTDTALLNYTTTANLDSTVDGYGYLKSADLSGYATESYVGTAIDNLVDGAPALLNTLNELAAAINDDANYTTTITTALGTKAPLASPALTGVPTAPTAAPDTDTTQIATTAFAKAEADAAQTAAATDATTKANAAQAAAETTASGDATTKANAAQAAAELYADGLTDDMLDGTTPFTDLNINDVAKQVAARTTSLGSVVVTAYQFNKSTFKSGKFLVKIDNGTHNEVSEILVTLDSSDNVAITEYAIVGTNGSRGTITADVDATHCRIRVNPVNDSTITVSGTVFNS